jgi:hypothetical protein
MTIYFKNNAKSEYVVNPDVIESIRWDVEALSGRVTIITNEKLDQKYIEALQDWIMVQNYDGLGEGFTQQDFAQYDAGAYDSNGRYIPEWDRDEDYEEDWIYVEIVPINGDEFIVEYVGEE